MKKITLFFAALILTLSSCTDSKIKVVGEIDSKYNGQTVYLYTVEQNSFNEFKLLAKTTVDNNMFSFDGLNDNEYVKEKDLPMIGYISLFDMTIAEDDITEENAEAPMATVIIEKGLAKVVFSENSVTVGGTARNEEFNKMHQAIKNLVDFSNQFESYDDLDTMPANAEGKDGRAQLEELDKKLRDQSFSFIKNNMTNSVGEYLFIRSGDDMFTPTQMLDLIDAASESFKAREEVKQLKGMLNDMSLGMPELE